MVLATPRFPRTIPQRLRPALTLLARHGLVLWLLALVALSVVFVLRESEQLSRVFSTLRDADGRWVLGAAMIELGLVALTGITYQVLLRRLGHPVGWVPLAGIHLRRVLIGTVVPLGGPASLFVLVRSLARHGVPAEDAVLAAGLRSTAGYGAFLLLLLPAIAFGHPTGLILTVTFAMLVVFLVIVIAMGWLLRESCAVHPWEARLPQKVRSIMERTRRHGLSAADFRRPFSLALAIRLGGAAMLYVCLRAVGEQPSVSVALIAYVVGLLFLLAAPVFGGVGVVEIATAVALERLGVPAAPALAAALVCRLTELWLPLALGLFLQLASARGTEVGNTKGSPSDLVLRPTLLVSGATGSTPALVAGQRVPAKSPNSAP